jgi:hypothetical protein
MTTTAPCSLTVSLKVPKESPPETANQTKNNTYGQHKDNKTILSTTKHIIYQIREVTWLWKVQLMLNKIDIYISIV